MDMESDFGEMEVDTEKSENILFVEQILMNNLDIPAEEGERAEAEKELGVNLSLIVSELDMRVETYFGDERVPTLSRLVATRIKFWILGEDEERLHFWLIKIPSIQTQERELASAFGSYQREITFYSKIYPSFRKWLDSQSLSNPIDLNVPTCFFASANRPLDKTPDLDQLNHILKAESLLVLEDLRACGFGKRHFAKGLSLPEVFAAVEEIAKWHAISYAMQVKGDKPLPISSKDLLSNTQMVDFYTMLFQRGFSIFKNYVSNKAWESEELGKAVLGSVSFLAENVEKVLGAVLTADEGFPTTLIHMDFWSDNLLFRVQGGEDEGGCDMDDVDLDCVLIDWQMVSWGKPTHDLALLFAISLDPKVRREVSHHLLQFYYQCWEQTLGAVGLAGPPFDYAQLVIEYSSSCLLALIMAMSNCELCLLEQSTEERLIQLILDLMASNAIVPAPKD